MFCSKKMSRSPIREAGQYHISILGPEVIRITGG